MRRVLLTIMMTVLVCVTHAKTFLVCVGISDYPGRFNDLRVSAEDPKLVKRLFEVNGNSSALLFTNSQASLSNVISAMRHAYSQAGSNDAVVFFFSGHGIPGGFACYDGMLYYRTITDIMKKSRATTKIVLADACYSGSMRRGNKHDNSYSKENVMFFLSSRTGETSREMRGWKNSVFTTYLVRGLRGGADANNNRIITARELFNFVSSGVIKVTKKGQHPVMWGKFDGNMTILKW